MPAALNASVQICLSACARPISNVLVQQVVTIKLGLMVVTVTRNQAYIECFSPIGRIASNSNRTSDYVKPPSLRLCRWAHLQ
jgi:hypothetical protein